MHKAQDELRAAAAMRVAMITPLGDAKLREVEATLEVTLITGKTNTLASRSWQNTFAKGNSVRTA